MNPTRRPALLNRAVFTQRAFDSRALSVLTTLVQRFVDPGHYEVFIRRAGTVVHRTDVHVAPEHGRVQIDVDMANVPESKRACGCHGDAALELRTGGVVAFYVSSGVGGYTVTVTNRAARDDKAGLALDNSRGVPAGGLFALTLVQPGTYRIATGYGAEADVSVRMPRGEKDYRPDRVTRLTLTRRGFEPASAEIFSGQSVAILCEIVADIRAELVDEEGGPPAIDRSRGRFRRPAPPGRDASGNPR
jgi:hypothetical protein